MGKSKKRRKSKSYAQWSLETRKKLLERPGLGEPEVAAMLLARGWTVTRQRSFGRYFIDIAIEQNGHRVAVELDDPTKDLTDPKQVRRTKYLTDNGWVMVRIDGAIAMADELYVLKEFLRVMEAKKRVSIHKRLK